MKNLFLLSFLVLIDFSLVLCSSKEELPEVRTTGQIIADHTVVGQYDKIPQAYIDKVKKMLVEMGGQSHSKGYRVGAELLELIDSRFQVLAFDSNAPPAYSDQYLRLGRSGPTGEDGWYTSGAAVANYKNYISKQYNTGNCYSVLGLVWCYTMTWENAPGGIEDPVYGVHWAGSSFGGPQGNLRWGLDSGDESLTGNSVCIDTYLDATNQYNTYCTTKGYTTKVVYTTGPVDDNSRTEAGYQRELKHDHIRAYAAMDNSRILFDYADILCYNNRGVKNMVNWNDGGTLRPHAQIHPDNLMDYDENWNMIAMSSESGQMHIGEVGALRLGKAMWWMLARIAGWDGISTDK